MTALPLFDATPAAPVVAGARPLVVGLDLSLTCTGISGGDWVDNVRPKKLVGHPRIAFLHDHIVSFIKCADLVVIEGPAFGHGAQAGHEELAGLRMMIRHACWSRRIPYAVMAPSSLKLYATGNGRASKGEVRTAVQDRYGVACEGPARYDEADALALAAAGLHWLGHPLADVPERNEKALAGVQWPHHAPIAA